MTSTPPPLSARAAVAARLAAVCRSARVRALYAFGSRERQVWRLLAGGRARGHSDLDLAVLWLSPEAHDRFARRADLLPIHRETLRELVEIVMEDARR